MSKIVCSICNGVGTTFVGGRYVRCPHCHGNHTKIAESVVVGYNGLAIKKKAMPREEIARDW